MVSTKSTLEANDSQQDFVVSRSKLGKVFRSEGPRRTPVQQDLKGSYIKAGPYISNFFSRYLVFRYDLFQSEKRLLVVQPIEWLIQLWKLGDTSDTLIGRACYYGYWCCFVRTRSRTPLNYLFCTAAAAVVVLVSQ